MFIRVVSALLGLAISAVAPVLFAAGPTSEFLDIHPQLTPDRDRPGVLAWTKPGFERVKYTKVMLEPLTVFVDPDSEYQGFDSEDVRALAAGFRDTIARTLAPEIAVVDAPDSGVLHVRAALTHVKLKKPPRGLLSYTPAGLIVTAVQEAAGKRISLQDAALEVEAYDASGEPIAVIVNRRPTKANEELSWKGIEGTFEFYAMRFKSRMLAREPSD